MGKLEQDNSLNLGFNVSNIAKGASDAFGFSVTVERRLSTKSSFSDVVSDFSLFRCRMNLRLHKKKQKKKPVANQLCQTADEMGAGATCRRGR